MAIIYYRKTENRKEFVFEVLNLFKKECDGARTFLLKPNIVSYEKYPTTTHPDVLDAALSFLSRLPRSDKSELATSIIVSDGPAPDAGNSQKILNNSPLKEVCDSYGVPLINLYSSKVRKFTTPRGYKLKIFALPLERDFVISLPVLKIHGNCQLTGALKNQFGYFPRWERYFMHLGFKDINKGIAEINLVAKPNLFIIDAVQTTVTAQELRHGGKIKNLGYIFAGTDPVSLDSFGLKLLQQVEPTLKDKSPQDIPHIKYAFEYGLGEYEAEEKEI